MATPTKVKITPADVTAIAGGTWKQLGTGKVLVYVKSYTPTSEIYFSLQADGGIAEKWDGRPVRTFDKNDVLYASAPKDTIFHVYSQR